MTADQRVLPEPIRIYVCFEPNSQAYAERLDSWPWTNQDLDFYNRRVSVAVDSHEAEPIKLCLRQQIEQADVTVCVISISTAHDPWIAWELEVSRSGHQCRGPDPNGLRRAQSSRTRAPNGLVGVMLNELDEHPPAMVNCGAMFVPFKRDLVERAVRWVLADRHTSDDFTLRDF